MPERIWMDGIEGFIKKIEEKGFIKQEKMDINNFVWKNTKKCDIKIIPRWYREDFDMTIIHCNKIWINNSPTYPLAHFFCDGMGLCSVDLSCLRNVFVDDMLLVNRIEEFYAEKSKDL